MSLRGATRMVYTRQLTDQVDSIKHSLAIQLDVTKKTLDSVTKQLDRPPRNVNNGSGVRTARTITIVKEDYIKAQDILQSPT